MQKMLALFMCVLMVGACSKEVPPTKYPERLPIKEQAEEITKAPAYVPPKKGEQITPIEKGEVAAFDGLLIDEEAALGVAKLRIAYDEVYQLNLANNKYTLFVIGVQEQELYRADQILDQKEAVIKKIRDSWWQRNKFTIGVVTGVVLGVGLSVATGIIWAKIDNRNDEGGQP